MALKIAPATLKDANKIVQLWHRHHRPTVGGLFAICVVDDSRSVVGVAIVGRPVSRHLDDNWTVEVARVCTDGTQNACSMLLGACWRAARSLGYARIITYTLPKEGGASLRAAGWECLGTRGGGSWSRKGRQRIDNPQTLGIKHAWSKQIEGVPDWRPSYPLVEETNQPVLNFGSTEKGKR